MKLRTRIRVAAGLTVLAAAILAAVAWAAPDRQITLSAGTPTASWDGGPVTGVLGLPVDDDNTQITVESPGTLTVKTAEGDDTAVDVDLWLYKADAAGDPDGDPIKTSEEGGNDEVVSAEVEPGSYVAVVYGFLAVEGFYKGSAELVPAEAAAAPPPGGEVLAGGAGDTRPEARITKLPKSVKASRLRGFSGTAKDDKGVARVEIAVVQVKGKSCKQLTSSGKLAALKKCSAPTSFLRARGTTGWSYKLKRPLPKGSYTLFARAKDSAGQVQGGFGSASRKSFKVR